MLEGTTAEIKPREALRINPAKTCQPIGAMYAALGIHGCMPHSHGSQGCCAIQALSNIFTIYDPEIVAVHTTCLSEVIGDDIPMMIKKATEDGTIPKDKYVIHANTPSFVGSHITGFANMTTAMVRYLAERHGHRPFQLNLIPGWTDITGCSRAAARRLKT